MPWVICLQPSFQSHLTTHFLLDHFTLITWPSPLAPSTSFPPRLGILHLLLKDAYSLEEKL